MEKLIDYILLFGHLNKQQIDLIKSKASEIELHKDDYYWEAGKTSQANRFSYQRCSSRLLLQQQGRRNYPLLY